jgi:hypothetical protein
MQVRITRGMAESLKTLGHVPDDLRQRLAGMAPSSQGFVLTLSDDDAMALAELVQWHIRTDPATGKPTAETAPLAELIRLIDETQF